MTTYKFYTFESVKKTIGIESEPSTFEIEKEPIRRWADAIGDHNPLYHDEEYCKKLGYRSLIAPPSFLTNYDYPLSPFQAPKYPVLTGRTLNGGNEYECYLPVQAGDKITITIVTSDVYQREGRLGLMTFIMTDYIFRNEKGEKVGIGRHLGIHY